MRSMQDVAAVHRAPMARPWAGRMLLALVLLFGAAASARAQWVTAEVVAPGVEYRVFDSAAVGGPVSVHVWLPPAYAAQPGRRFPVLYWLHGSGGGLDGIPVMAQRVGQAVAQGLLPPLVVVFPNGLPNGMWSDAAGVFQPVESMLVGDLMAFIDTRYRTIPHRSARLLDGFSMGGYGAARLGFEYRHRFAGFSMIGAGPLQLDFLEDSPEFAPLPLRIELLNAVWGGDPARYLAQHPWTLAGLHGASLPVGFGIRQIIGTADSMLRTNRDFRQRLIDLGLGHAYVELPGVGHNMVAVMNAMGEEFWRFHREALAGAEPVFGDGFESPLP